MTLVVVLPLEVAKKPRWRLWRLLRSTPHTATLTCEFVDEAAALAVARTLPYVWGLER